ncbi:MAG TPA: PAS domain-containing protein, partial [Anaerolineaceae bacterium]
NRCKGGETMFCRILLRKVLDESGEIVYLEGLVEDITRRMQAEKTLKSTQSFLTALLEHAPVPIYTDSTDDRITLVNRAWEELRGIPRERALGVRLDELFSKKLANHFSADNHKVIDNAMPIQFEETVDDPGGRHTFQTIKFPLLDQDGHINAVGGISIDITKRIQAEDALRQSGAFNRSVLDSLSAHLAVVNSQGKVIATNEAWNRFAGENGAPVPANHYLGANYLDVCVAAIKMGDTYARQALTGMEAVLLGDRADFSMEYPCDSPDTRRWFVLHITSLKDHNGSVVVTHEDITARKQAEEALRREQTLMNALMDNIPDTIYFKDMESRFLRINQSLVKKHHLSHSDEALGKNDFDYFTEEHALQAVMDEQKILSTGQPIVDREEKETWPDRPATWVSTTKMPLRDPSGALIGTFGLSRDITGRKMVEDTLQRQNDYLRALQATTLDLVTQLDLDSLLQNILLRACQLVGTPSGVLFLVDRDSKQLAPRVGCGALSRALTFSVHKDEGLAGRVWQQAAPLTVDNYDTWPGRLVGFPEKVTTSSVGMPLISTAGVLGVLELAYEYPDTRIFSPEELEQLTQFARLAAIAIENARLFADSQQRLRFIQSLRIIDQAITGSFDLRVVINILLGEIMTQLKVDAVDLLLLSPGQNMLDFHAGRGFRTDFLRHTHLRIGEGYAGEAALEGRMVCVPDLNEELSQLTQLPHFKDEGFVSYHVVPLISKGMVKGVLEAFTRSHLEPDSNWIEFFEAVAGQAAIAVDNSTLFTDLQRSTLELSAAYDATIQGLSHALDLRDQETGDHSVRLMRMTERLAREMGVSEEGLVSIRRGALLHDIGKIGVPDSILHKAGVLSPEDWVVMRKHPILARDLLEPIKFLRLAIDIPYCHHEKWDGSGYPNRLAGEDIPLAARLFAIVDVYDALSHKRVYRDAWPTDKIVNYLREQSGEHFDPAVVEVFLRLFA